MLIHTLKVLGERFLHVQPVVDGLLRQVVNPLSGRALQHQWEVLDGDVGVTPGDLHRVAVVLQPCSWFRGAFIGLDGLVNPKTLGVIRGLYYRSKAMRSQVLS